MTQIGIFPWSRPMPHDHSAIGQGGPVPIGSITGHSKALHDALALALGSLTFDQGCKAYRNGAQVIGTGAWTKVAFNAEDFDVGGNFAANDFVAPSDGYYLLFAAAAFMNLTAGAEHGLEIRIAGTAAGKDYREIGVFQTECGLFVATIKYMTATQAANAYVYQNSGGDKSLFGTISQTFFCAVKIGG